MTNHSIHCQFNNFFGVFDVAVTTRKKANLFSKQSGELAYYRVQSTGCYSMERPWGIFQPERHSRRTEQSMVCENGVFSNIFVFHSDLLVTPVRIPSKYLLCLLQQDSKRPHSAYKILLALQNSV